MWWSGRIERRLAQGRLIGLIERQLGTGKRPGDAWVVSGFWRSGTTWVLEALCRTIRARAVFEPMHQSVPRAHRGVSADRDRAGGEVMPYIRPSLPSHPMDEFFSDALCGRISTRWTRKAWRVRMLLSRRIVVKLVRGNLVAGYLQRRFGCRLVLIIRHPCGAIASLRRSNSSMLGEESDRLLHGWLADPALAEDHLDQHRDTIERWRRTSPLARLALAHAIAHVVPLRQADCGEFRPTILRYEELVMNPSDAPWRGFLDAAAEESLTTEDARRGVAPGDRCFGWQTELTREEIDCVLAIYDEFGEPLTTQLAAIEAVRRSWPLAPV